MKLCNIQRSLPCAIFFAFAVFFVISAINFITQTPWASMASLVIPLSALFFCHDDPPQEHKADILDTHRGADFMTESPE